MQPSFLLQETVIRDPGTGPELDIAGRESSFLLLTLGITRIVEQESVDVSVWGSSDGKDWGAKPLIAFPQKFYCGTYQILLDLREHPEVRYIRAKWQVNRWGKGDLKPLFGLYLFVQEARQTALAMTA